MNLAQGSRVGNWVALFGNIAKLSVVLSSVAGACSKGGVHLLPDQKVDPAMGGMREAARCIRFVLAL